MIETSLDRAEPAARTVALGSFDGVHLGHRRVIEGAIAAAAERGTRSSVVTFEPHPMVVLRPELAPHELSTPAAAVAAGGRAGAGRADRDPVRSCVLTDRARPVRRAGAARGARCPAGDRGPQLSLRAPRAGVDRDAGSVRAAARVRGAAGAAAGAGRRAGLVVADPRPVRGGRGRACGAAAGPGAVAGGHDRARRRTRPRAGLRHRQPGVGAAQCDAGDRHLRGTRAPAGRVAARRRSASATTRPSRTSGNGCASRRTCSTSTATSTGSRCGSSSCGGCAASSGSASVEDLVAQVHRDIDAVRAEPLVWQPLG